jgi:S-adenosylmethionine synthetase
VLLLAGHLKSADFRSQFPVAGDDFKVMGLRQGRNLSFTIALAFIGRHVGSVGQYFEVKEEIRRDLLSKLETPAQIEINTLDDPDARNESGVYLTVSGLSAEMGDDGQVGRGNRVNGLISPCRPMSLEAAAGKNPAAHVGKLYNVLARIIANDICTQMPGIGDVNVRLLSIIGQPVDQPQIAQIEMVGLADVSPAQNERATAIADYWLSHVEQVVEQILQGRIGVF